MQGIRSMTIYFVVFTQPIVGGLVVITFITTFEGAVFCVEGSIVVFIFPIINLMVVSGFGNIFVIHVSVLSGTTSTNITLWLFYTPSSV